MTGKSSVPIRVGAMVLIIIAVLVLLSLPRNSQDTSEISEEASPELTIAAEDLNNVLPQRVALNTHFDSVGVSQDKMNYYYSINHLTANEFSQNGLSDSLMTEAVDRIPCTLWRPAYMQGVEVSFIYFSSDSQEILRFTRVQQTCS